jgi:hypothetical protein
MARLQFARRPQAPTGSAARRAPDVGSSDQRTHCKRIITLDLTDDEARAPAKHLRQALHGHTPLE